MYDSDVFRFVVFMAMYTLVFVMVVLYAFAEVTASSKRGYAPLGSVSVKLQALVYNILPSTTAVFSYAIGSRKRSANEQLLFCWCSNSSKFVTNNSNKTRRVIYSCQQSLHQHK